MKVVMLVPGTGNFHCGSCMRDHVLAAALRRQGVEAVMAPMYLPAVVDENHAADRHEVFFGGINTYLQQKSAIFRHTPRCVDRVLDARPLLKGSAALAHMTRADDLGALTLSMLKGEQGKQIKELDRLVRWIRSQGGVDGVMLNNLMLIGLARRIREATGAAIVCTMHGEDSFIESLPEPYRTQAWQALSERAADVDVFIPVSRTYGEQVQPRLGFEARRMHVIHNGIDVEGFAPSAALPDPPVIGYLSRLCQNKGLGELVDAFILLRRDAKYDSVRLAIAGAMTRADKKYVRGLGAQLAEAGLDGAVSFEPNISLQRKQAFLHELSVLSVPATYGESFGLYLIEAWASGVPVVQPRSGAFEELLAIGQGGMLHEPNDAADLVRVWKQMLGDPAQMRAMGMQGRRAVLEQFTSDHMAAKVMQVLCEVTGKER